MRQIILGKSYGYLGGPQPTIFTTLRGGGANREWSNSIIETFPEFRHSHPWSVAGTFKHWYVQMLAPVENGASISWTDTVFALCVNGVATALTVTVPAAGPVSQNGFASASTNLIDEVTVTPGDVLSIQRVSGTISGITNGLSANMDWAITFDGDVDGESGYGCGAGAASNLSTGSISMMPVLSGDGNGFNVTTDTITSTTAHSIVPVAGSLTRIDIALSAAPGVGHSRTFVAALNGTAQDGSGGTVDTTVTISDTATSGFATFTLPLVPLDWLSLYHTSIAAGPAAALATASVAFTATTNGQSALCFDSSSAHPIADGSTDWAAANNSGWAWTTANAPTPPPAWRPTRFPSTELLISLPGSPDPFTLKGFCVNLSASPGSAKSYLFQTRQAFANAAPKLTMTGASGTNSVLFTDPDNGSVDFATTSDRLNIQAIATGTPAGAAVGWAWLMVTATTPPPPPPVITTYPVRRLRRFMLPWDRNLQQAISRIEFIMQTGEGLVTGQGSDPVCMVRFSKDGGRTWGTETSLSLGQLGAYMQRVYLNRPMGSSNNRQPVCELTVSDPVFTALLSCVVHQESGTS